MAIGTPATWLRSRPRRIPHIDQRADIYALGVLGYELRRWPATVHREEPGRDSRGSGDAGARGARRAAPRVLAGALASDHAVPGKATGRPLAERRRASVQLEPLATPSGGTTPTTARPIAGAPAGRRFARWFGTGRGRPLPRRGGASAARRAPPPVQAGASHAGDASTPDSRSIRRSAPTASSSPMWPDRSGPCDSMSASSRGARRSPSCETFVAGSAGPPGRPTADGCSSTRNGASRSSRAGRITAPARARLPRDRARVDCA